MTVCLLVRLARRARGHPQSPDPKQGTSAEHIFLAHLSQASCGGTAILHRGVEGVLEGVILHISPNFRHKASLCSVNETELIFFLVTLLRLFAVL